MLTQSFGERTWNLDCLVAGTYSLEQRLDGLRRLIAFLGMDMDGMPPDIRSYPLPNGQGGKGQTIYQPFVEPRVLLHQPLTTSFVILDIWPEHFTLTLKSCIRFSPKAVAGEIVRLFGPLWDWHDWTLGPVAREHRTDCGDN